MNRLSLCTLAIMLLISAVAVAGDLNPPGSPSSTMVALDELESRTPISSLPFTISSSGSYFIAGDLTGSSGITISASNVTLDLMGHSLIATGGSGDGIAASGTIRDITILNGSVRSWGADGLGLDTASSVRVINVSALDNSNDGIVAGDESQIINCIADNNTRDGYNVAQGSLVINCVASDNDRHGIFVGDRVTVRGCSASQNGSDGIEAGISSMILDNTCSSNGDDGIRVIDTCTVQGNSCTGNGTSSTDGAGIYLEGRRNRIESNNVSENDIGVHIGVNANDDADENFLILNTAWTNGGNSSSNYIDNGLNTRIITSGSTASTNPFTNFSFYF